jgi:hypothetical protein
MPQPINTGVLQIIKDFRRVHISKDISNGKIKEIKDEEVQ